jgi:hypothetical protein
MTPKCKGANAGIRKIANFEHFCYLGDNAPHLIREWRKERGDCRVP